MLVRRTFLIGVASVLATPSIAKLQRMEAGTELVLFLDASSSMFKEYEYGNHWTLQKKGHVTALGYDDVKFLILQQKVYVRVLRFGGKLADHLLVFDHRIENDDDYALLLEAVGNIPAPTKDLSTDQYLALEQMLRLRPVGYRRVADICTDDLISFQIVGDTIIRRQALEGYNVSVNVLAVDEKGDGVIVRNLESYLQTRLPVSFTEPVLGWKLEAFSEALRKKLILELS